MVSNDYKICLCTYHSLSFLHDLVIYLSRVYSYFFSIFHQAFHSNGDNLFFILWMLSNLKYFSQFGCMFCCMKSTTASRHGLSISIVYPERELTQPLFHMSVFSRNALSRGTILCCFKLPTFCRIGLTDLKNLW